MEFAKIMVVEGGVLAIEEILKEVSNDPGFADLIEIWTIMVVLFFIELNDNVTFP